jgi:hypothetical protein
LLSGTALFSVIIIIVTMAIRETENVMASANHSVELLWMILALVALEILIVQDCVMEPKLLISQNHLLSVVKMMRRIVSSSALVPRE